jgi:dihydrofolate reductase
MVPTYKESRHDQVGTALSTSLDGFIAGPDDSVEQPLGAGGARLFAWYSSGDTPSRHYDSFKLSPASAQVFDDAVDRIGAIVAGRRTYDVSGAWGGTGPLPGRPLFVLTHRLPDDVPVGDPPSTFVTDGIQSAVEQAKAAADGKDVGIMGANAAQQCLRAGLLDVIQVDLVPVLLGGGVRLFDNLGNEPQSLCARWSWKHPA